jgi:hypothetical protein
MQLPANKDVHPIVWFANQPESYCKNHMVITLSVASPSDANLTRTFVSLLNTDGVPNNEHNVSALEGIGMSLYGCLLLKANMKNKTIQFGLCK